MNHDSVLSQIHLLNVLYILHARVPPGSLAGWVVVNHIVAVCNIINGSQLWQVKVIKKISIIASNSLQDGHL